MIVIKRIVANVILVITNNKTPELYRVNHATKSDNNACNIHRRTY